VRKKTLVMLATAWVVSLLGVGLWARSAESQGFERRLTLGPDGQILSSEPVRPAQAQGIVQPGTILSGSDIGFRLGAIHPGQGTNAVSGTWVIRLDGQWVEVGSFPFLQPAR
jgi:hypothetical protein